MNTLPLGTLVLTRTGHLGRIVARASISGRVLVSVRYPGMGWTQPRGFDVAALEVITLAVEAEAA